MNEDIFFMRRCLSLARLGEYYVAPNPMVGAVLVKEMKQADGEVRKTVVGEGYHKCFGEAHAEVNCFLDAVHRGYTDVSDCTLYVSLEPCSHYGKTPPCAELIIRKGVKRVVAGMSDPNVQVSGRGLKMLREAGIDTTCGVLEDECRHLNRRFLCLHEKHRPYVILKWAQTADGYIDIKRDIHSKGNNPLVISTPTTKQLVHQMRAENMAIMVGTRTALLDNPRLNNTRWAGRNPIRVVTDRHGVLPSDSRLFSPDTPTLVYRDNTDFPYILHDLAQRGIHSLLVEGGTTLIEHILQTGIYDEIHIEVSPIKTGNGVAAPDVSHLPLTEICNTEGHQLLEFRTIHSAVK